MPEFLNRWRTSIIEFWARLERGQKIRLVTGVVLGLALLAAFMVFVTRPQYEVLYENLSHADVGKITEELKTEKIPYKLTGTTIYVPKEKVDSIQADLCTQTRYMTKRDTAGCDGRPRENPVITRVCEGYRRNHGQKC